MAGAVLNEREGAEAVRGARRVGWGRAVFGSACLWAWGFLAYLSPVLIPAERPVGGVGIEVGFFVSQGAVVVAAVAIVLALRKRSVAVGRGVLLVCASLLALASALLPLTVAIDAPWPLVGCGAICGVAGTLLGCAWGARYSLESRDVSAVVMVSFLVAYGIYFAILLLYVATPFVVAAQVVVVFLPLASWGLWFWDASARSGLAPEVFPSSALSTDIAGSPGSSGKAPGEVTAGLARATCASVALAGGDCRGGPCGQRDGLGSSWALPTRGPTAFTRVASLFAPASPPWRSCP